MTVDCRLLPGPDPGRGRGRSCASWLGEGDYELSGSRRTAAPARRSRRRSGTAIESFVAGPSRARVVAPCCSPASPTATGCARRSARSPTASSRCARWIADLAARLVHSADERVHVDDLELGARFLRAGRTDRSSADYRSRAWRSSGSAGWRSPTACSCTARPPGPARCGCRRDARVASGAQAASARPSVASPLLRGPGAARRGVRAPARSPAARSRGAAAVRAAARARRRWSPAPVIAGRRARHARADAGGAGDASPTCSSLVAGRPCAARRRARRLPRRRAHLDRHLRARRAAREGARALRLAPASARCSSTLAIGSALAARAPAHLRGRARAALRPSARSPRRPRSSAGWCATPSNRLSRALARARPRAPAPAGDGRADAGAARGRRGGAALPA